MGQRSERSVVGAIDRLFRVGTAAGLSDAQLLERFATRHDEAAEAAFAALIERHGPMVLRVCRRMLGDPHDAEDALQATFLILVRKPGAVRQRASLAGWLYGVALRVAAHSRAASARRSVVEQAAGSRRAALSMPDDSRHEVWEEVDRLPERYRLAVVLCYLEGLTHEQAAARLGWPVGTVRSRLARAREQLRGRLIKRGLAPGGAVLVGLVSAADARALPLSLIESTVKAAMLFAVHDAAEAGLVSVSTAALTEGVLHTMFIAKFKTAALVLVMAGAVVTGAGVYGYQTTRPEPSLGPAQGVEDVAKRYALYPERIAELTRTASAQQKRGNLSAAAETTLRIASLASEWSSMLRPSDTEAPPTSRGSTYTRPGDHGSNPANFPSDTTPSQPSVDHSESFRPGPGTRPKQPQEAPPRSRAATAPAPASSPAADDTNRRLAEVEKKLEHVLRALVGEGPSDPQPGELHNALRDLREMVRPSRSRPTPLELDDPFGREIVPRTGAPPPVPPGQPRPPETPVAPGQKY